MNTRYIFTIIAGAGALAFAGCSPKDDPAKPVSTSGDYADRAAESAREAGRDVGDATREAGREMGEATREAGGEMREFARDAGDTLSNTWNDVADATYEDRGRFSTSMDNLERSVDAKIEELQARGSTLSASARESWDRNMERLRDARADLRNEVAELQGATADNWRQAKADVAEAWQRVRESLTQLESQPTS